MGDKVCRVRRTLEKQADGPWITVERVVCEDKKPEEEQESKRECWYERLPAEGLVKQLGGTSVVMNSVLVRKCKPIEQSE